VTSGSRYALLVLSIADAFAVWDSEHRAAVMVMPSREEDWARGGALLDLRAS
jgi:hypothetical protein